MIPGQANTYRNYFLAFLYLFISLSLSLTLSVYVSQSRSLPQSVFLEWSPCSPYCCHWRCVGVLSAAHLRKQTLCTAPCSEGWCSLEGGLHSDQSDEPASSTAVCCPHENKTSLPRQKPWFAKRFRCVPTCFLLLFTSPSSSLEMKCKQLSKMCSHIK